MLPQRHRDTEKPKSANTLSLNSLGLCDSVANP